MNVDENCECKSTKEGNGLKSLDGRKRRKRKTTKGIPATTLSGTRLVYIRDGMLDCASLDHGGVFRDCS